MMLHACGKLLIAAEGPLADPDRFFGPPAAP
jgi:hypothetical protein